MTKYILIALLCAVPGVGQTTFTVAREFAKNPYLDRITWKMSDVRTLILRDYQDAVRYQEWDNIRRIGRFLTMIGAET